MALRTSDVVPISEGCARLNELADGAEHAGLVLLDEAETGLRQLLAGPRVTSYELTQVLSDQ